MKRKWKGLWTVFLLAMLLMVCATAGAETVAKIGEVEYDTLDEAIAKAVNGDTITLLQDAETESGFGLNGITLTVEGNGHKIDFKDKTIYLKESTEPAILTFKDCQVKMTVGTPQVSGESYPWAGIVLNWNCQLILDETTFDMDGSKYSVSTGVYMHAGAGMTLQNDSSVEMKNYIGNGFSTDDGKYDVNVNILGGSSMTIEQCRTGFNSNYVITVTDSKLNVLNSRGHGSNGADYFITHSNVTYENNGSHGMSARNVIIKDHSVVNSNKNRYYGVYVNGSGEFLVDSTSSLTTNENGYAGLRLLTSSLPATVEEGGKLIIDKNLSDGLWNQRTTVFEEGSYVEIMYNHDAGKGGGIYNTGILNLPSNAVIYNNHADKAGDDIYSTGTITFGAVGSGWYLDGDPDCYDAIDGWYDDSEKEESDDSVNNGGRWEAHDETALHIVKQDAEKYEGLLAIKAAHDIIKPEETPEPSDPGINLTFRKVWDDVGNANRPDSITLKVYRNGEYFRDLKLSYKDSDEKDKNSNTWTFHKYGWSDAAYTVVEVDVSGYASGVEVSENDPDYFIITNTYMPATGDDTPVTRYLLMLGGAALLIAAACVLRARKKA